MPDGDVTPRVGAGMKRRVGILGGMGPEATVLMMSRVLAGTDACSDQEHIPMLVDCNTGVPSRIDAIVHRRAVDPGAVLASMARGLEAGGAEALAMPCNTAHLYADEIVSAVEIPLLNMVSLTARRLAVAVEPGARVGLLASPAVVQTGLYERALRRYGIEAVYPPEESAVLSAILAVKAGASGARERAALQSESEALIGAGVSVIAIACTELSTLTDLLSVGVPVVDALDVLVDAVIAYASSPGAGYQPDEALFA